MKFEHVAHLIAWTITVLLIVGFFVIAFTLGDCMDVQACATSKNRAVSITLGIGFVVYWAVFIGLIRRWSR